MKLKSTQGMYGLLSAGVLLALMSNSGCTSYQRRTAGYSVEGRPIEYEVLGHGNDVAFILATIHGNEAAGTPLVEELSDHLRWHPNLTKNRTVVLLAVANPDGFAQSKRYNVNGIDLNRNFPADNFSQTDRHGAEPLSEPESRAIKQILDEYQPSRVVSIHQPVACIDYDGPAAQLAEDMAKWSDLPVKRIGSLPGSLGSYAGITLGVPIITLELPKDASDLRRAEIWRTYGEMLVAAIQFVGPAE